MTTRPEPRARTVVVVKDRRRYHRADCRYVRDVPDTATLTRRKADGQGYVPCGVCAP